MFLSVAPPTEKMKTPSFGVRRLVFNHSTKTVAQPSSFVRAVSSDTLSVGAYDSIPTILRKSFTACEQLPAPPPYTEEKQPTLLGLDLCQKFGHPFHRPAIQFLNDLYCFI